MSDRFPAVSEEWVREILAEFDLEAQEIALEDGWAEAETDRGRYRLQPVQGSDGEGAVRLWDRLSQGEAPWLPQLERNKYGDLLIHGGAGKFVLVPVPAGAGGDYRELSFQQGVGKALARFHGATAGIPYGEVFGQGGAPSWRGRLEKRLERLKEFVRNLEGRLYLSPFDEEVLDWADPFLDMGQRSLDLVRQFPKSPDKGCGLALGSMEASRFLRGAGDDVQLAHLENMAWDHPMADLARACLEALRQGGWQSDAALRIIEAYEDVRPLSREDHGVLLAEMLFPHEFHQLVERGYRPSGRWDSRLAERLLREAAEVFPLKVTGLSQLAPALGYPDLLRDEAVEMEPETLGLGGIPDVVGRMISQFVPDPGKMVSLLPGIVRLASQFLPKETAPPVETGREIQVVDDVPEAASPLEVDLLRETGVDDVPEEFPTGRYLPLWFRKAYPSFKGQWGERVIPWAQREGVQLWPTVEFLDLTGDLLPSIWLSEAEDNKKRRFIGGINLSLAKLPVPSEKELDRLARSIEGLHRVGVPVSLQLGEGWLNPGWLERIDGKVDRFYVMAGENGSATEAILKEAARLVKGSKLFPVIGEGNGETWMKGSPFGGTARLSGKKGRSSAEMAG